MIKKGNQIAAAAMAAAIGVSCLPMKGVSAADTKSLGLGTYEAEELEIGSQQVWTSVYETQLPGYSGDGFVYLTSEPFSMTVNVDEEGMYEISVRAAQILSTEGRMQTISINGSDYTFTMPYYDEWTDVDLGAYRLKKGDNVITFKTSYGYAEYDTVTISKAEFPTLNGDPTPCDPKATDETKALLAYLSSVYGKNVLSGQQEIYGGGHKVQTSIRFDSSTMKCVDTDGNEYSYKEEELDKADDGSTFAWHCYDENGQEYSYDTQNRGYVYNEYDREIKYLKKLTGKAPAIRGFDFGSYCPCYAWDDGVTERMIDWAVNQNGICTASWHINVPTKLSDYTLGEPLDFSKTTYSEKTDFVTANVMIEGTLEHDYFDLCMENLAKELLQLQEAGVPVLFRPFHEAEGNGGLDGKGAWFWWAKEGAKVHADLWKYLYTTLTEKYGLHNLIWEENLYAWGPESAGWYIGDDYVDIVGFDKYDTQYNRHDGKTSGPNEDCNSSVFWSLVNDVNNGKLVAMPENSTIPSISNMTVEHANWLYFCTWYDEESSPKFISGEEYNNADTVIETYQSDYCITLDELPADLYVWKGASDPATEPTSGTPSDGVYGDANGNGEVELADAIFILQGLANPSNKAYSLGNNAEFADCCNHGNGVDAEDALVIQKYLADLVDKLPFTSE